MASFTSSRGVATVAATHNSLLRSPDEARWRASCTSRRAAGGCDRCHRVRREEDNDDDDDDDDGKRRQEDARTRKALG